MGLNNSLSWCNTSCTAISRHVHGMSAGAIAGAVVGALAGVIMLAAAFLVYRAIAGGGKPVGGSYATSEMVGRAHNNPTFTAPAGSSSNTIYVQMSD